MIEKSIPVCDIYVHSWMPFPHLDQGVMFQFEQVKFELDPFTLLKLDRTA